MAWLVFFLVIAVGLLGRRSQRPARNIPEVPFSTPMENGPAVINALRSAWRLRGPRAAPKRAQISADAGASIDDVEDELRRRGLEVGQQLVPPEHVFLSQAGVLPAIVVTRDANRTTWFEIAWRREGDRVQMLGSDGRRRWEAQRTVEARLYRHLMDGVSANAEGYLLSDEFLAPLRARLSALSIPESGAKALLHRAAADATGRGVAALDAGVRLAASLTTTTDLEDLLSRALVREEDGRYAAEEMIGPESWYALPDEGGFSLFGAVVVPVRRRGFPLPA